MSVKLYEINGEWRPFEYWHDYYGYTKYDTFTVSYKTTANWGTIYSDSGYMDMNESLDIFDFTFFVPGVIGWHNLDDLALAGYYPSSATDLTVYNVGGSSNAASIEDEGTYYYLVEQDISQGWMSQDEFEARGWSTEPLTKRIYFIINESTGEIVYSADESENSLTLVCETIASSFIPDSGMVVLYNYAEPTIEFWLGADGRASTENTTLQSNNKQYLRGEDGQLTTDADIVDTYDQAPALSFVKVDGNTFEAASGDYAFKNERYPDSGYDLSLYTVSTGSDRSAWAVLLKKDTPDVLTLWAKISDGSEKLYRQTKVTSSTTTITAAYLYELYTDEALTQRFVMDVTKAYELGSFKNQLFVPSAIQNVSQMPSSTTSSNSTRANLLIEQNGASYLWCVTNSSASSSYDVVPSNKYKILCRWSLI